jgi:hypothetical protein
MNDVAAYERKLRQDLANYNVPEHCQDGLIDYLVHGHPVGSFLTAVLSNDLREAAGRADETNRVALHCYVAFLYNCAPAPAWGSEDAVARWRAIGGHVGLVTAAASVAETPDE